jgi:hypothetical protein
VSKNVYYISESNTFTFPGIAVGRYWTGSVNMTDTCYFLYQLGQVDELTWDEVHYLEQQTGRSIESGNYDET